MSEKLNARVYRPNNCHAAVFIVHGMQEHKGRYDEFADYLCRRGIGVVTYDLPGHGEKAELQGWFGEKNGYQNLVRSAADACVLTRKEFPKVPVFCLGHSMGSLIARNFLQKYSEMIDGMILSGAPCYNPAAPAGKVLVKILSSVIGGKGHSTLLDKMVTGAFNKAVENPETECDWISYNKENVRNYLADELCGIPFTVQGYGDLLDLVIHMHDPSQYQVSKPTMPILLAVGEDDPCTGGKKGVADSVSVLEKAGYTSVKVITYPHMRHEILNENDRIRVFEDIAEWIERNEG